MVDPKAREEIAEVKTEISEIKEDFDGLIGKLVTMIGSRFDQVDASLGDLEKRLTEHINNSEARINEQIENSEARINERFDFLEALLKRDLPEA